MRVFVISLNISTTFGANGLVVFLLFRWGISFLITTYELGYVTDEICEGARESRWRKTANCKRQIQNWHFVTLGDEQTKTI